MQVELQVVSVTVEPFHTIRSLAEMLRTSTKTVYGMHARGELPAAYRVGGQVRFDPVDVRAWLDERREQR